MTTTAFDTLPPGWRYTRLKWLLDTLESGRREVSDTDDFDGGALSIGGEHIGWQGQWQLDNPRYVSREFFAAMASGKIQEDDILLVKDGATIGKVAIATSLPAPEAAVNEHVFLLRVSAQNHSKYYFYFIQSSLAQDQIQLEVRGSAQPGLNSEFRNVVVAPRPPREVQRTIADYLDRETARLDGLVAAKERVLRLLAEKRRALITNAVTRGLDGRAPLRNSGIPWLGKIPAHWAATRLRFAAEVRGGLTLGKNYGTATLGEYPYLRVANVQDGHLDLSDVATVLVPEAEAEVCLLEAGDVLMNEGGDADKLGRGCIWTGEIVPCLHQNHVFAVRPRLVRSEWLNACTSTEVAKAFFESRAKQSTNLASISATNIKELPIPVPPADEQGTIVAHIKAGTVKLDALRTATERTIALLKERRAALIAAAVTGQIDVGHTV